jgi:hypothetical protein
MEPIFLTTGDECYAVGMSALSADAPVFLSRIGGSDTNALVSYLQEKELPEELRRPNIQKHQIMVKRFNGYYDKNSDDDLYYRYCETLLDCYKQSGHLIFCNYQLLSLYFKGFLDAQFYREDFEDKIGFVKLVDEIVAARPDIICYPYQFVERAIFDQWDLFRVFSKVLPGKKVLAVSPFAESIQLNFPNRNKFFNRDFVYPDFQLQVYNTPITYEGLPEDFYPHANWFETLEHMKADIAKIDFDVALLACGSYALALGVFVEKELHRKAVYVGGMLQIFFGIMGRRYEGSFGDQINPDQFIYPVERDRYLKFFTIDDRTAREAFGAYF